MKNKQVKQMICELTYKKKGAVIYCKHRPYKGNTGGVSFELLRDRPNLGFAGTVSLTADQLRGVK